MAKVVCYLWGTAVSLSKDSWHCQFVLVEQLLHFIVYVNINPFILIITCSALTLAKNPQYVILYSSKMPRNSKVVKFKKKLHFHLMEWCSHKIKNRGFTQFGHHHLYSRGKLILLCNTMWTSLIFSLGICLWRTKGKSLTLCGEAMRKVKHQL